MAGLSAAIALSAQGRKVLVLEKEAAPGGKMRRVDVDGHAIDAGPTVLTMKWVFDRLFALAGTSVDREVGVDRASVLARHGWADTGPFDLFADQARTEAEVERVFGGDNAAGYRRFCADSKAVFETLRDTFIAAPRPSPIGLGQRIGLGNPGKLLALRPFHTLWQALGDYFPDDRLRQLFGRYATYVGSSPYQAPATLMLIAHVEREGVWTVRGGMHELALAMARVASAQGADIRTGATWRGWKPVDGRVTGVRLASGDVLEADTVVYNGDASRLSQNDFAGRKARSLTVPPAKRSLSALTWTGTATASGFALQHHNVFFSSDYRREFDRIFRQRQMPDEPTVYICAQDRTGDRTSDSAVPDGPERLLCLINAPAFGDERRLTDEELALCKETTFSHLRRCGLDLNEDAGRLTATQPADFETLFPGSGGALYGRASHGWTASFARSGTKTRIGGLYLAGGSVHPGAGVPMATLSGMLAAERIMADHAST